MRKLIVFVALVAATIGGQLFGQTTIFVSTSGDDANNGATWETAKATLAGALTAATGNTHIYMKVGVYASNDVVIPSGVTVTGGYKAASSGTDTTQRNYPGANYNWTNTSWCTILSGGNTSRVATVNNGGKLEGCVVRNGMVTDMGGGLLIDGGTVMHCVLWYNKAISDEDQSAKGGGAYIRNNGYLLNCVVTQNSANNGPGVAGTDGTLTNNTIANNYVQANCGTVTDYDGNVYHTVVIGSQCWMKENLRSTHYADGADITLSATHSSSSTNGYRCYPNDDADNVSAYGYLYNWSAVMRGYTYTPTISSGYTYITPPVVQGACPVNWHVPSENEWNTLVNYVKGQPAYCCNNNNNNIAKALSSNTGWYTDSYNSNSCSCGYILSGNNKSGFSAMPAGEYPTGNAHAHFAYSACFWTRSFSYNLNGGVWGYKVPYLVLSYSSSNVSLYSPTTSSGFQWGENRYYYHSVRCIRD